jgi:hypothetical protein
MTCCVIGRQSILPWQSSQPIEPIGFCFVRLEILILSAVMPDGYIGTDSRSHCDGYVRSPSRAEDEVSLAKMNRERICIIFNGCRTIGVISQQAEERERDA